MTHLILNVPYHESMVEGQELISINAIEVAEAVERALLQDEIEELLKQVHVNLPINIAGIAYYLCTKVPIIEVIDLKK